ncbi:hypothetical protein P4O66_001139 [Electrophorus voltai]|uniref:Uncharacterized protein n=1 Tax=Electrophorus voltai TaxID=2609070 RepID=A0AAD9DY32_9TELE|nr:hypothetical protein P4O66_001139 [Electrophorus voltai]
MESVEKESGVKRHSQDISKAVPPPLPRRLGECVNEKAEDRAAGVAEFSGVIHVSVRARKCRKWRDANAEMKSAFWTADWQFQSPPATTICDGVKCCESVQREVTRWTEQSVAALQDALDDADWDMFRHSTDDVNEFMEAVVGFIGKLVDDMISRTTIKKFPNQKPCVDKTIREALNSRTAAYNAGIIIGNIDE